MLLSARVLVTVVAALAPSRALASRPSCPPPFVEPAAPWRIESTTLDVDCTNTGCTVAGYPVAFTYPQHELDVRLGCPGSVNPVPIDDRHPVFGGWREREPRTGHIVFELAHATQVTVTFPGSWNLSLPGATRTRRADGRVMLQATVEDRVAIARSLPAVSWIRHGGPFIAAGGTTTPAFEGSTRFALRAGYELARPGWLIYSLAAETDFSRVTVVPAIEAALPTSWHLHWAAGLGLPVELAGERAVGGRFQVGLHSIGVGLVWTVDVFPSRDETTAGIYGQLSL